MVTPMIVHLTPEDEKFVEECLRTGRFENVAEVIHNALKALQIEDLPPAALAVKAAPASRRPVVVAAAVPERRPRRNLVDVLSSAPFAGSDLSFERPKD
jgi:putative addiction module CopG family antidote